MYYIILIIPKTLPNMSCFINYAMITIQPIRLLLKKISVRYKIIHVNSLILIDWSNPLYLDLASRLYF